MCVRVFDGWPDAPCVGRLKNSFTNFYCVRDSCKKASAIIFFALQLQVPRDDADAAINKGDDETKKNLAFLLEKVEGESEIFRVQS